MKLKHLFFPVLLLSLVFVTACSETKEESKYVDWRERNEHFIDSLTTVFDSKIDPNLFAVVDQRNKKQLIFYKKIESSENGERPLYTSRVNVLYRGMLIDEEAFKNLPVEGLLSSAYKNLNVFDGNFNGDNPDLTIDKPAMFPVIGDLVTGFGQILQIMRTGDRWEIYIPHQSGYGKNGSSPKVPGYSSLIFDLTLVSIEQK